MVGTDIGRLPFEAHHDRCLVETLKAKARHKPGMSSKLKREGTATLC